MVKLVRSPVVLAVAAVGMAVMVGDTTSAARAAGKLDRSYIVVLESPAGKADATTDDLQRKRGFRARLRFRRALRGFAAQLTEEQVERLRDEPAVASVTPDRPVQALGEVDLVPGDSAPTGVLRVGAATPVTARQASSATVAVLDTGIDLSHPDLNAADGINCVAPGTPAQDDEGHGTHVAGTISARNDGRGVVGVAPGTRTHAVKVLNDEAEGSTSQVLCGIDWVTATRADTDPSNDISVINLSLGGSGPPVAPCATTRDPLHRAICASTRVGVTYVVAAGNEGRDFDNARTPRLPAAYPEVLTATAMSDSDGAPGALGGAPACRPSQIDDVYASFSNYATTTAGAAHTVAGPGVCIRSTWPGSGYTTISGTSMASPHVAGAVALCLGEAGDAGPCAGLSPAGIVARMRGTGRQNAEHGFLGDPLRPVAGRYFGPLAWAGPPGTERAEDVPVPTAPTESGSGAPAAAPPQPAPAGPPVADTPPAPTAADRTAPTATLSIRRRRLSAVLRRGLGVTLSCSEGCVAAVEVWLPGRTARRLKLSRGTTRRIARRSPVRLAASTRKGVVLKLSRAARARLARARGVTLRVKVAVSDAGGNRRAVTRRARVRR